MKVSLHREPMTRKGNKIDTWRHMIFIYVVFFLNSCSTFQFYTQALGGQTEIMRKARPVKEVLADPTTKPLLSEKLRTVEDLRIFALSDLGLPAEDQYERYTNLGRAYVVWVVFAAPEFSVQAKTWWYPLVGSVKYRGFFQEDLAEKEAEKLRAQGLDVFVGGVEAYSTLGYLKDPLLNTFIGREDADLAELIFHELTHQRLYLSGDTDFNEALATVVGREGARRWLKARGRKTDLRQYETDLKVEKDFIREVLQTRAELKTVYEKTYGSGDTERLAKKAAFARLKERLQKLNHAYGDTLKLDRWFEKPVNNARLNTLATYYDLVPAFEALLKECHGDLEVFLQRLEAMRSLNPKERRAKIQQYIQP